MKKRCGILESRRELLDRSPESAGELAKRWDVFSCQDYWPYEWPTQFEQIQPLTEGETSLDGYNRITLKVGHNQL